MACDIKRNDNEIMSPVRGFRDKEYNWQNNVRDKG